MCDEQAEGIGDVVPDEAVLYRACTKPTFLTPQRDAVAPDTFYKAGKNHRDGLSLALSAQAAIEGFKRTHGVVKITAADIRSANDGIEVRYDATYENHVLIRNMPCMDREPNERLEGEKLARILASRAKIESTARVEKSFG